MPTQPELADDDKLTGTERANRTRARDLLARAEREGGEIALTDPLEQMTASLLTLHGQGQIEAREVPHIIGTRTVDFFMTT